MGFLESKLKPIIIEALGSFTLAGGQIGTLGWSSEQAAFLEFCLNTGAISRDEFKEVVIARIKQLGRESYRQHIDKGTAPDHTASPQALAYAIRTEALSGAEVDKIKFDHGDNRYTFLEGETRLLPHHISEALQPMPDPD